MDYLIIFVPIFYSKWIDFQLWYQLVRTTELDMREGDEDIKDREDDTFSWPLTKIQSGRVTSDEQSRAQETQNLGSHRTPIQEALGISWTTTRRKLISINHQSFIPLAKEALHHYIRK